MAAVAVAGAASAQATITGALGFGVSDSSIQARSFSWTDTYINFAASEDLGGGMSISASQKLQAVAGDTVATTSNGSALTIAGGFGTVTYASTGADADNLSVASLPISTATVFGGTTDNYTYLDYTLPTMVPGLGITIRANNGNAGAITVTDEDVQYRFSYTAGPVTATMNTTSGTSAASEVGASIDLGVAKISVFADTKTTEAAYTSMKQTAYSIVVPVSSALTASMSYSKMAAYSTNTAPNGTEFNATYALSKRTSLSMNYGKFTSYLGVDTAANRIKLVHSF